MKKNLTPALKQYVEIKENYKDTLLMFRMGDFYELFFKDAEIASKALEITLTSRPFGKSSEKVPMCGVPYHSVEPYIEKLVKKGFKVAICEQIGEPKPGKIVKREVVRVITPGTYFEDEKEDRFLMSIVPNNGKNRFGIAWVELSTGDIYITSTNNNGLYSIVTKFQPKEILIPEKFTNFANELKFRFQEIFIQTKDNFFFKERSNLSFETIGKQEEQALSGLINFIEETQLEFKPKLKTVKRYMEDDFIYIDPHTCKNLELLDPLNGSKKDFSLFGMLNKTETGMGRRFLKFSILHPLKDKKSITERLDSVEELKNSFLLSEKLTKILKEIYDIERILSKITSGIANPRELAALRNSLKNLPLLKTVLKSFETLLLKETEKTFDTLEDIYCQIEKVLVEEPPFSPKEGGIIKKGVNKELDELRKIVENGEEILKTIEERERKKTGIANLKIKFNNVFGYYIEISKANLHLVPDNYIRKQTLVNAERFITPELKEFEEKILSAKEKIEKLEYKLFTELRNFISQHSERIQKTAEKVGFIDFLLSLSKVAQERDYTKPEITENYNLYIEEGKHPVLEKILEEDFIPNSIHLTKEKFIAIVTGPNMGGKSVFLRQTALITLMAQIGSFVPAKYAKIGLVDRIFSRVGASDNLSKGLSTFMMEMVETANILNTATDKSLVILDEIGRGTSTYDGISIAKAVVEHIANTIRGKTLFATHYHELTELEKELPPVFNLHVTVKEINGNIIFTHKIEKGCSEKSYGIHVAELAGLPEKVTKRAKELLMEIESEKNSRNRQVILEETTNLPLFKETKKKEPDDNIPNEIISEIERMEISTTTPLDALMTLARLKQLLSKKV